MELSLFDASELWRYLHFKEFHHYFVRRARAEVSPNRSASSHGQPPDSFVRKMQIPSLVVTTRMKHRPDVLNAVSQPEQQRPPPPVPRLRRDDPVLAAPADPILRRRLAAVDYPPLYEDKKNACDGDMDSIDVYLAVSNYRRSGFFVR